MSRQDRASTNRERWPTLVVATITWSPDCARTVLCAARMASASSALSSAVGLPALCAAAHNSAALSICLRRNRSVAQTRLQLVEAPDRFRTLHSQEFTPKLVVGNLGHVHQHASKDHSLEPGLAFPRLTGLCRMDQHPEDTSVQNDDVAQGKSGRLDGRSLSRLRFSCSHDSRPPSSLESSSSQESNQSIADSAGRRARA